MCFSSRDSLWYCGSTIYSLFSSMGAGTSRDEILAADGARSTAYGRMSGICGGRCSNGLITPMCRASSHVLLASKEIIDTF